MFLAVDIGNTSIHLGVLSGDGTQASWRLSTSVNRTPDEYKLLLTELLKEASIDTGGITATGVCSVSPRTTDNLVSALRMACGSEPMVVSAQTKTGLSFDYDVGSMGGDRIADVVAVRDLYPNKAVVVVDAGTGLVFDAISADGVYMGGAIAPGLELSADALNAKTNLLPSVAMQAPSTAIGKDTSHAIRSGLLLGTADLVRGMVRRFKAELLPNNPDACLSVLTGGYSDIISKLCPEFDLVDEYLTLKGILKLYELNS